MKVVILNQCSTNKGDRAVLYFVIRELLRNGISDITVSTSNPSYWQNRSEFPEVDIHYIPFGWNSSLHKDAGISAKVIRRLRYNIQQTINYPLLRRAFLQDECPRYLPLICDREFLNAVQDADLIVSTGGHHLTTINATDAVYAQTFDMAVVLMLKKNLILWSQSIGPFLFKSEKNRSLVEKVIRNAGRIYIRNAESKQELQNQGVSLNRVVETCESVFGLYDLVRQRTMPSVRASVMGVSIYATNRRTPANYNFYVESIAVLVNHAISRGYRTRFYPMELAGTDRKCIDDIVKKVIQKNDCKIMGFPSTPEHLNSIAECRMFVGHKTHSVIFALVAQTPLLAISYHKKTQDFLAQFNMSEYCIDDKNGFSGSKLIDMFERINTDIDTISQREQEIACQMSQKVQDDFRVMLNSVNKKEDV